MATAIIDGTIEEAQLRRSFYKMRVYNPVVVRRADGELENLGKRIIHSDLVECLTPGRKGRFYLYSTIEHQGIHGFRGVDGATVFAFAKNNEIVGFLSIGVGMLLYLLHYSVGMPLSGWAPILLLLGAVMGILAVNTCEPNCSGGAGAGGAVAMLAGGGLALGVLIDRLVSDHTPLFQSPGGLDQRVAIVPIAARRRA